MSQLRRAWPPQGLPSAIQSGTLVNRPAAAVANRYYWATDIFMLFRDTGAAWEVVPGYFDRWLTNATGNWSISGFTAFGIIGRVSVASYAIAVRHTVTIDRIVYGIGTTAAGSVRVALYRLGSFGWPDLPDTGVLAVESASDAQPATSIFHSITIPDTQLIPGFYFPAIMGSDATGTYRGTLDDWRHSVDGNVQTTRLFANGGGYAAFDNPCPVTAGTANYVPVFWLRVASIP